MGKDSNSNCYKNAICISVGLLILFTTSIFVAKDYYGLRIATLIEDAALLKDYRFSDWGEQPGNIEANYTYTFTLADQSAANQISPIGFAHSFKYNDVSFGQGNQGFIKYLHQWTLTPFTPLPSTPISTINLAAEKVYAFERLAPKARRFTTLFNTLWRTAEEQLLNFYAKQLHAFYFSHKQTVFDAVYAEAGIEAALMDQLYSSTEYGWGSSETLQIWVLLTHQQNRHDLREWELVREAFGLSAAQLERLVGDHSMLNALSTALNGTIKVILQNSRTYAYDKCQPFCSNNQLVAFQMLTNALTNSPVFVNVNLKSSLKGLNASIPNEVEFSSICTDPTTCFLDQNSLKFFATGYLRSFSTMGKVYSNIDSVQIVQGLFDLPDATYATGILSYIKYLEDYVFTPTNPATQQLDHQAYEYMLNNHLYINTAVNDFKNILNIQLHTRAFAQLITNHQTSCEDFFQGDYAAFAGLCKKAQFDLTQLPALRTYVKAYFFNGRPEFLKATGMNSEQAIQFLRLDGQSLFTTKMKEVRKTLAEALECTGGVCNEDELLAMEWSGEKDVLSRLPPALFPHPPVSITEWDIDNKLNGIQPQFHKLMGEKLPLEEARLLLGSGPDSILVLFNLLSLKTKGDSGDQTAQKLVGYVQKVSIDVYFGGPTIKKPINDLLSGLQSKGLKVKQAADRLLGGAPWLPSQLQLIQTSRRPSAYSKLNTGIYDRNQLRSVMQVEHSGMLGSQFTIFSSENEQVTQFLSSGRSVFGTNLLGFHSDLSSTEAVAVLMDFAYQGVVLHPQSSPVEYMGVQALKYSLGNVPKVSISMNQQNERLLSLSPDSYFTVDPVTGNTLQFNVKYSVSSPTSFLKYYPGGDTKEQPLFSCEVKYQRKDVSAVLEIGKEKAALRTVYIVTIILASLSMVSVVVLAILARIRGRKGERDFNETLVTSENRGSINN